MPPQLTVAYGAMLNDKGIMLEAMDLQDPGNVIGGPSCEETAKHFARRYGVSCSRVQSLVLDPHEAFGTLSDDLINIFSEGDITVLDLACGAGSVGASLISTIAALRRSRKLPAMPTTIDVIGADCSASALGLYRDMISRLAPDFSSVAIDVNLEVFPWDAALSYSTSDLFDFWFSKCPEAQEYVVFVADFSGASFQHYKEYEDSFKHVLDRTQNKRGSIVWVEPGNFRGGKSLFDKLGKLFARSPWGRSNRTGPVEHDYLWFHPFQKRQLPCRVLLQAFRSKR